MQIAFDYRFDTDGFFNDPERRAALEAAGNIWENLLQDDFAPVPAGIEFTIVNPETQQEETIVLEQEIDDLLIFVASSSLQGQALAEGGPGGTDALGDVFARRISSNYRGTGPVTNFEPWAGTITFGSNVDWDFSLEDPDPSLTDFISLALHEIAHVLGIGTSGIFDELVAGGLFQGFNALGVNEGEAIPLAEDLGHVEDGFRDNTILLDPTYNGGRNLPTEVDLALLADIGYEISGFTTQGFTPPLATDQNETIFGTILADAIAALEGNDQVQGGVGDDTIEGGSGEDLLLGGEGNDFLSGGDNNDQLQGGVGDDTIEGDGGDDTLFGGEGNDFLFGGEGDDTLIGEEGRDRFIFGLNHGNDVIQDFVVAEDVIEVTANFNIIQEGSVIGGGLFTDISFSPNNEIRIFHDLELTEDSIVVDNAPPDLTIVTFDATADLIVEGNTTVELIVTNQGDAPAGSFTVDIIYSDDDLIDENDEIIATVEYNQGLEAGENNTQSVEVSLDLDSLLSRAISEDPGGQGLDYQAQHLDYLGAIVDPRNVVLESNENNNQAPLDDITFFPWDINQSGEVTPTDLVFVLNRLGNTVTEGNQLADLNRNGLIESDDAFSVLDRLGYEVNNQALIN